MSIAVDQITVLSFLKENKTIDTKAVQIDILIHQNSKLRDLLYSDIHAYYKKFKRW